MLSRTSVLDVRVEQQKCVEAFLAQGTTADGARPHLLHMTRVVRRFLLVLAALAVVAALPGRARADGECSALPAKKPVWIDFADGSVPFWEEFARPGVVAAASNLIFPPKLRAAGAQTVYWDMYLNKRVGTPGAPADPETGVARAHHLIHAAARTTWSSHP